jgi:hypothetical protein
MTLNLQDLKEKAERATPGPWHVAFSDDARPHEISGPASWRPNKAFRSRLFDVPHYGYAALRACEEQKANAAFIAAFSPSTAKAMIQELEEARAWKEKARELMQPFSREAEVWNNEPAEAVLVIADRDGSASPYDLPVEHFRAIAAFLQANGSEG